jgi:hypothetical protein
MVPTFWLFLADQLHAGKIRATKRVYDELTEKNDKLAEWCKLRKSKGLCITPSKEVQECYKFIISPHVTTKYRPQDVSVFHRSADGWVIAQAMVSGDTVVTLEVREATKTKIKIPIICKDLGVKYTDPYEMLRELGWKA